jgi:hypothetical protein
LHAIEFALALAAKPLDFALVGGRKLMRLRRLLPQPLGLFANELPLQRSAEDNSTCWFSIRWLRYQTKPIRPAIAATRKVKTMFTRPLAPRKRWGGCCCAAR